MQNQVIDKVIDVKEAEKNIAANLLKIRKSLKISRKEAAAKIGISDEELLCYETNLVPVAASTLVLFSIEYGLPFEIFYQN